MSLRTALQLDLIGNVVERARTMGRAMTGFASTSNSALSAVKRGMESTGRGLDTIANKYTGLVTGLGLATAGRQVIALEDRINALAVAADKPVAQMEALKAKVLEISQLPDIRLDPNQILDAVDMIVEKTGDLDYAEKNLANIGRAIKASGGAGESMGAVFADLNQKLKITNAEDTLSTLDILVKQGKSAAFSMKDLAEVGPRVTAAMGVWGRTGKDAAREMGALLQIGIQASGSKDVTATGLEALTRDLVAHAADLRKIGVQIFDPEQLLKGKKVGRALPDVVKDLLKATNGDPEKLRKLMGDEAGRFIAIINQGFKETGGFSQLDSLLKIEGDGGQIAKDSAIRAQTTASAIVALQGAFTRFADSNLSAPIKAVADALDGFSPERIQQVMQAGTAVIGIVGALVAARKAAGAVSAVSQTLSWIKNGDKTGAVDAALGVQKVFVVNLPPSLGGVAGTVGAGAGAAAGAGKAAAETAGAAAGGVQRTLRQRIGELAGRAVGFFRGSAEAPSGLRQRIGELAGRATGFFRGSAEAPSGLRQALGRLATGPNLGRALGLLGTGVSAYSLYKTATDDSQTTGQKVRSLGGLAGSIGGGLLGSKVGSTVGNALGPVGGVIGSLVGSVGGSVAGNELATRLVDYFQGQTARDAKPAEAELTGRLAIQIQSDKPVRVGELVSSAPNLAMETSYLGMNGGW